MNHSVDQIPAAVARLAELRAAAGREGRTEITLGASPASLFRRLNTLYRTYVDGVEFQYVPGAGTSGVMEVRFATERKMKLANFML